MAVERGRARWAIEVQARAALVGERVVHFRKLGRELANVEPAELLAAGQGFRPADFKHSRQDPHQ